MKRLVLGALVSAVAVFFWGFIYWNILPLRNNTYHPVADEAGLAAGLRAALPATGVYELPRQAAGETEEAALDRYKAGPIAEIIFLRDGAAPYAPSRFILGFLHMFVSALLMGGLLLIASPYLPTFGSRVKLLALAGIAGAFFAHFTYPIWYFHPWSLYTMRFLYDATCWLITALILARFVRQPA